MTPEHVSDKESLSTDIGSPGLVRARLITTTTGDIADLLSPPLSSRGGEGVSPEAMVLVMSYARDGPLPI